jgi:hypothetical protein
MPIVLSNRLSSPLDTVLEAIQLTATVREHGIHLSRMLRASFKSELIANGFPSILRHLLTAGQSCVSSESLANLAALRRKSDLLGVGVVECLFNAGFPG